MREANRRPLPRSRFSLGLFAVTALGAAAFVGGIGGHAFWFDELLSVSIADRSLDGTVDAAGDLANMGLYYLLLHGWMWVGDSETWVRLLSALAAIGAVPMTALLARRLFGDAVGLASGLFLVGSLFVVQNAQHARAYALALLFVSLATWFFVDVVESNRRASFVTYGVTCVLAIYASPLSGLVFVAHAASLAFLPGVRVRVRSFAVTYVAVLAVVAPLAVWMASHPGAEPDYLARPGFSDIRNVVWEMLGAADNKPLRLAYGAFAIFGLLGPGRRWITSPIRGNLERWRRTLVIGWLLAPPALLFIYSQAQPLFLSRYLLTSAPAVAIVAGVGLVSLGRRSKPIAIAAAAVVLGLGIVARADLEPYGEAWASNSEEAARVIADESRRGDGLVYDPRNTRLFDYYLNRASVPATDLPSDFSLEPEDRGRLAFDAEEAPLDSRLRRLRTHPRVWLVGWVGAEARSSSSSDPIVDAVRSQYESVSSREFGSEGVITHVELFQR